VFVRVACKGAEKRVHVCVHACMAKSTLQVSSLEPLMHTWLSVVCGWRVWREAAGTNACAVAVPCGLGAHHTQLPRRAQQQRPHCAPPRDHCPQPARAAHLALVLVAPTVQHCARVASLFQLGVHVVALALGVDKHDDLLLVDHVQLARQPVYACVRV
jgi:hypothetical protein